MNWSRIPMSATPVDPAAAPRACGNCGTPMLGDHCYRCGQPVKGLVRHFGSILGDFFDSVFDFDSRTVRTLGPLLFKPGYLTTEYFAGRRVRYVSPVRLFVFLCIVSFFVLFLYVEPDLGSAIQMNGDSFASATTVEDVERQRDKALAELQAGRDALPDSAAGRAGMDAGMEAVRAAADRRIKALQGGGDPAAAANGKPRSRLSFGDSEWDAESNPLRFESLSDGMNARINALVGRANANVQRVEAEPRLLVETVLRTLPQTFFFLLPVFALLLKLTYPFSRRLYMEHLINALHSHAFLCLSLLLLVTLDALRGLTGEGVLGSVLTGGERLLAIWMPLYLLLGLKRVYGQGWLLTLFKFSLLGIAYLILISVAAVINLLFNLVAM